MSSSSTTPTANTHLQTALTILILNKERRDDPSFDFARDHELFISKLKALKPIPGFEAAENGFVGDEDGELGRVASNRSEVVKTDMLAGKKPSSSRLKQVTSREVRYSSKTARHVDKEMEKQEKRGNSFQTLTTDEDDDDDDDLIDLETDGDEDEA